MPVSPLALGWGVLVVCSQLWVEFGGGELVAVEDWQRIRHFMSWIHAQAFYCIHQVMRLIPHRGGRKP